MEFRDSFCESFETPSGDIPRFCLCGRQYITAAQFYGSHSCVVGLAEYT